MRVKFTRRVGIRPCNLPTGNEMILEDIALRILCLYAAGRTSTNSDFVCLF